MRQAVAVMISIFLITVALWLSFNHWFYPLKIVISSSHEQPGVMEISGNIRLFICTSLAFLVSCLLIKFLAYLFGLPKKTYSDLSYLVYASTMIGIITPVIIWHLTHPGTLIALYKNPHSLPPNPPATEVFWARLYVSLLIILALLFFRLAFIFADKFAIEQELNCRYIFCLLIYQGLATTFLIPIL